jgi:predicted transcriptional regulator
MEPKKHHRPRLTDDVVQAIRALKQTGMSQKAISLQLKISTAAVCRILKGNRHAQRP